MCRTIQDYKWTTASRHAFWLKWPKCLAPGIPLTTIYFLHSIKYLLILRRLFPFDIFIDWFFFISAFTFCKGQFLKLLSVLSTASVSKVHCLFTRKISEKCFSADFKFQPIKSFALLKGSLLFSSIAL